MLNRLARSVLVTRTGGFPRGRVVVLCYHSVHPSLGYRSATPREFDEQLGWLADYCEVVPLTEVVASLGKPYSGDKPRVAITFDDGYADNHEHALPTLARRAMPATFFVTAGFLSRDPAVLTRFRELRATTEPIEPMSWAQLRELAAAGMEIGAHTYRHPSLADLDTSELPGELGEARRIIEDNLGAPVPGLAYPFGKPGRHFNRDVISAVKREGYSYAAAAFSRGVCPSDSAYAFPRFFATRDTVESLAEKIHGAWDRIGWVQERLPAWLLRMLSRTRY